MSVEFYRESPGKFDSRTLNRETLSRWTGRMTTGHRLSCKESLRFDTYALSSYALTRSMIIIVIVVIIIVTVIIILLLLLSVLLLLLLLLSCYHYCYTALPMRPPARAIRRTPARAAARHERGRKQHKIAHK